MKALANVDIFAGAGGEGGTCLFRARDNYSLSDRRRCRRIGPGESLELEFRLDPGALSAGTAEIVFSGMLELFDSHAYVWRFINSVIEIQVNGATVFDGLIHWRSHEETASYWPNFDFPFGVEHLRPGLNSVRLTNKTSRRALGEFFDPELLKSFSESEAERKLATLYLSGVEVNHVSDPPRYPRLGGVPSTAIAGRPFIVEVNTGDREQPVAVHAAAHARVTPIGAALEFGCWRSLFEVLPDGPGETLRVAFDAGGTALEAQVPRVYAALGADELITGPGAETTYWHQLKPAVMDCFELGTGNCVRMSIDDFLNNCHHIPLEKWIPLIAYLVRRRHYYALQRLRVPPYSRIQHQELGRLADMGGPLFAGVAVPEPINRMPPQPDGDLARRQAKYLEVFEGEMAKYRLPGHRLVTFDSAGGMCGHYYRLGLDVQVSEIGPACNVTEEICARGAATAYGKPWGVACAMHWYCGQGASYACDESRVRLTRQIMASSYLAGARQIVWEGGVFDNLPVYNFILSEESWRDYGRRYAHPVLRQLRGCFRELLDLHRAQQLSSPRVRYGVIRGVNDLFRGTYVSDMKLGDMSVARAWTLLKVFLPHFSFGRHGTDHGRPHRRWYSGTPFGAVDVVPAEAGAEHFGRYSLLALVGWNTMTEELHQKLVAYVRGGGTLFLSLPHLVSNTAQVLEWSFFRGGDLRELCGARVSDLGGRIEEIRMLDRSFAGHLPDRFVLTERNPLFVEDFDEAYPVFNIDTTYFGGDLAVDDAETLAVSQRGEPVLVRKRIGRGEVYLMNSWWHPGRGRLLPFAEGILRALAERVPAEVALDDPSQRVAWFEYPSPGFTRYLFLNTDWTKPDPVEAAAVIGGSRIPLRLEPGRPFMIASDGRTHAEIGDPCVQVAGWNRSEAGLAVKLFPGDGASGVRFHGDSVSVRCD